MSTKIKVKRCCNCSRKVGILAFPCRCNRGEFCRKCYHASDHNCTYDYVAEQRKLLEKTLVPVVADKVSKV
jgi:hypothetical protein